MENKVQTEILQRLTRVETKLDMMLSDREIASEAQKTANKALQSSESAHHRINEQRDEIGGIKSGVKWIIGTAISLIALFISAIGMLFKKIGG